MTEAQGNQVIQLLTDMSTRMDALGQLTSKLALIAEASVLALCVVVFVSLAFRRLH